MSIIHIESCPVCKASDCTEFLRCRDFLVSQESFLICKCNKCGFAFTQDFPSEDEIGKYYEAPEYISHSDSHQGIVNSLYHQARKITLRSKVDLIKKYSSVNPGTLLDIGCGTGYFLQDMRQKKWIVTGIEKSEPTRIYAHDKFGLNIQDSDYFDEIRPKTKDVITLWHVLEHLEKLNDTMSNLHRILKDDGTLIIALPNKESADALHYQQNWAAYDVPRHIWHFSIDDFNTFATNHGFKIIKKRRMFFDPFYISMLSEKIKGSAVSSLKGLMIGWLFAMQSFFKLKKSSSVIYILKKAS